MYVYDTCVLFYVSDFSKLKIKQDIKYLECQSVRPKKFSPPNPFAQNAVRLVSVRPPVLNVQGPFALILCMYYRHTMAYHRSCVMLKIPTVHSLKSVQISSTIFKISKINEQIEKKLKQNENSYEWIKFVKIF